LCWKVIDDHPPPQKSRFGILFLDVIDVKNPLKLIMVSQDFIAVGVK
jgi:hypothetical protein